MRILLFILLFNMIACEGKKEMTLEELTVAEWKPLEKGLYYISTRKSGTEKKDSVIISLVKTDPAVVEQDEFDNVGWLNEWIVTKVDSSLKNSNEGYLKLNVNELLNDSTINISIYLSEDYKTIRIPDDSLLLIRQPGVRFVEYMTREKAMKLIQQEGDNDWGEILTENPLPHSFKVTISRNDFNQEWLQNFEKQLRQTMPEITELSYPRLLDNFKTYYLKYSRV